jgi:hypothetical protein
MGLAIDLIIHLIRKKSIGMRVLKNKLIIEKQLDF